MDATIGINVESVSIGAPASRAIQEEAYGRRDHPGRIIALRQFQWRHPVFPLSSDPQGNPARDEHVEPWARLQQAQHVVAGGEQVLKVVEHEQQVPPPEGSRKALLQR